MCELCGEAMDRGCNHLSKGMRAVSLEGGASSDEEDGNEFIFEQVQDLAQRLVQCTSGLTQSIRGMQANAQQKDCQCGSDACFAPLLLNMLETTVIQCQGVLKLRRKLPSGSRIYFQSGSREKPDADSSLTMLSTIGDSALSIWHVAGANEIKAPASIEAILSSFTPLRLCLNSEGLSLRIRCALPRRGILLAAPVFSHWVEGCRSDVSPSRTETAAAKIPRDKCAWRNWTTTKL